MNSHQTQLQPVHEKKPEPLTVSFTDSGAHLQKSDHNQIGFLLLEIQPTKGVDIKKKSPLNLAVVVDRSTSMKGERLQKVKMATRLLLEKLSAVDVLSVVSYSDRAEVVVPAGQVRDQARVASQINSMEAAGGTEILQGLIAGIHELNKHPRSEYINHLILLTDGHTYGDDQECIALAQRAADMGIGISAFGLGSEWNDFFLDELVCSSGGQSGYIEEPEQIIHLLRQRIAGLGALYAQNLRMWLDLPPGVKIKDVQKVTPYAQPLDVHRQTINLGSMEGRTPLTILFELEFQRIEQDVLTLPFVLKADLLSKTPQEVKITDNIELRIAHEDKKLPRQLMEAVQLFNINRLNDRAWEEAQAGDVAAATRRMAFLTRRLEEIGLSQLAMTAKAQTMSLQEAGTLGKTDRMMIKYGTRVQLTKSLTKMFHEMGLIEEEDPSENWANGNL